MVAGARGLPWSCGRQGEERGTASERRESTLHTTKRRHSERTPGANLSKSSARVDVAIASEADLRDGVSRSRRSVKQWRGCTNERTRSRISVCALPAHGHQAPVHMPAAPDDLKPVNSKVSRKAGAIACCVVLLSFIMVLAGCGGGSSSSSPSRRPHPQQTAVLRLPLRCRR